jgi:hypothetical protein
MKDVTNCTVFEASSSLVYRRTVRPEMFDPNCDDLFSVNTAFSKENVPPIK